jgi:hypothetical protein
LGGRSFDKDKRSLGERGRNSQWGKGMREKRSERAREERMKLCQKLRGNILREDGNLAG